MRPQRPHHGQLWSGPKLPKHVLHDFSKINVEKVFLQEEGGVYRESIRKLATFQGAILPLSNEDLQRLPDGTSTTNSQKIYTNGEALAPGQLVQDSLDGQTYTVTTELTHTPIHGLKRYVVNRKGVAAHGG